MVAAFVAIVSSSIFFSGRVAAGVQFPSFFLLAVSPPPPIITLSPPFEMTYNIHGCAGILLIWEHCCSNTAI